MKKEKGEIEGVIIEENQEVKATEKVEQKELTKEERQEMIAACDKELQAVLTKYGCQLTAQVMLHPVRGIIPQVIIISAPN